MSQRARAKQLSVLSGLKYQPALEHLRQLELDYPAERKYIEALAELTGQGTKLEATTCDGCQRRRFVVHGRAPLTPGCPRPECVKARGEAARKKAASGPFGLALEASLAVRKAMEPFTGIQASIAEAFAAMKPLQPTTPVFQNIADLQRQWRIPASGVLNDLAGLGRDMAAGLAALTVAPLPYSKFADQLKSLDVKGLNPMTAGLNLPAIEGMNAKFAEMFKNFSPPPAFVELAKEMDRVRFSPEWLETLERWKGIAEAAKAEPRVPIVYPLGPPLPLPDHAPGLEQAGEDAGEHRAPDRAPTRPKRPIGFRLDP